jgi:phosphatidylglycerophosphate synthase
VTLSKATLGRLADLLTLGRLAAAPALAVAVAAHRLAIAAALLAGGWLTDALDGQAARASGRPTVLGRFDLVVDTAVGAGAVIGLTIGGEIPTPPDGHASGRARRRLSPAPQSGAKHGAPGSRLRLAPVDAMG